MSRQQVYDCVSRIPVGRVATYGQIASLCGHPRHARQVGYALAALPFNTAVPWHRVVNANGGISLRRQPGAGAYQRTLLEDEGIVFTLDCRIDLLRYQWVAA